MWDKAAQGFKFELGQLVIHRCEEGRYDANPLVVINRLLVQTDAGIRRMYLCGATYQIGSELCLTHFFERELTAKPVKPTTTTKQIAAKWAKETAIATPTATVSWSVDAPSKPKRKKR